MEITFETVWQELQNRLRPGLIIPNWTYLKGYLGDTMRIEEVEDVEIVVQAPKAKTLQHVSKANFEIIWKIWPEYKTGLLPRQEMIEITRYSKYIISIFHWLDTHSTP